MFKDSQITGWFSSLSFSHLCLHSFKSGSISVTHPCQSHPIYIQTLGIICSWTSAKMVCQVKTFIVTLAYFHRFNYLSWLIKPVSTSIPSQICLGLSCLSDTSNRQIPDTALPATAWEPPVLIYYVYHSVHTQAGSSGFGLGGRIDGDIALRY